jgi:4-hydroxy-3-polyprenylbenzoate decarboxylase
MVRRLIVGITGASGVIHGIRLLEVLRDQPDIETHLVLTRAGERTIVEETAHRVADVRALATVTHPVADIGASIASGSFRTTGMVVIPCSIHTLSAVAYCQADNLLTRAADVTLKERRRLVLVVRETPLHRGHLAAMLAAADAGAVVMPPMPGFYGGPKTLDDLVNFTVGRVLDLLDIEHSLLRRWGDAPPAGEDG